MSATDELRRMLDERGVEYKRHYLNTSWYAGMNLYMATDDKNGTLIVDNLTPEQAISATLGGGTLTVEQVEEAVYRNCKFYEGCEVDVEAIADELNSRAERTCKFVSSKGSDYPPVCSACGYELGIYDCEWFEDGTYGYDGNYCPNCGCKVVCE